MMEAEAEIKEKREKEEKEMKIKEEKKLNSENQMIKEIELEVDNLKVSGFLFSYEMNSIDFKFCRTSFQH